MTHSRVDDCTVGTHPIVVRLLKGMFNERPPAPRYTSSWEVTPVVESLRSSSEELTLLQLSKKVVTLMALSNADRCSDLAALDWDYMRWTSTGVQFTVVQLTKTRRMGPPRTVLYSALQNDPDICPVSNLRRYIEMTSPQVNNMKSPKPVFITSRKPFRRARPATLGHWIKDSLRSAGVDTKRFSAHSTRGASTSHAKMKGVPVTDILKVANWSSRSTFERFYHRPNDSSAFTRAVLQSSRNLRYITCFKRTTSKHCTLYPEPPKYNLQIPRGQSPHGEDGLYEEVEDTRYSGLPPLVYSCITSTLPFTGTSQRRRRRRWTNKPSCF